MKLHIGIWTRENFGNENRMDCTFGLIDEMVPARLSSLLFQFCKFGTSSTS